MMPFTKAGGISSSGGSGPSPPSPFPALPPLPAVPPLLIPPAAGDFSLGFKGDGAEYALSVSVIPDSQPPMPAILRLNSITCLEQAETFTDELYVTFNGTKRALPNMTRGQTKTLSDEFMFEGFAQLTMFENDGDHWYDRDDFIGTHTITRSPADRTLVFEAPALID